MPKKIQYDNNEVVVEYAVKDSAGNVIKNTYEKKLPTTTTANKILKSTSTAGTVVWGDAPATGVTSVIAGNGLTGGTITSSGTIAVDTSVIATKNDLSGKQNTIVAGTNITIASDGKTISSRDTTYTAGNGLNLEDTEFSIDEDVVALKEDIPEGELDVTFNGTATSTTVALNNVIVGTTTYTLENHITAEDVQVGA